MADGNLPTLDRTNPEQVEHAALATLQAAERIYRQMTELRDSHRAWYRTIELNEQGKVDDIVREAASKVVVEVITRNLTDAIIEAAEGLARGWVAESVANEALRRLMKNVDVKRLRQVVDLLGGKKK